MIDNPLQAERYTKGLSPWSVGYDYQEPTKPKPSLGERALNVLCMTCAFPVVILAIMFEWSVYNERPLWAEVKERLGWT